MNPTDWRTIEPKSLHSLTPITLTAAYEPEKHAFSEMMGELQDITIYPPPLYIMSPRMKIYDAKSIRHFKGYINKCMPSEAIECETPEMTITINPMIEVPENK